jgi:hypothetical protein
LKSSIDTPLSQTKFILTFYNILTENFYDKIPFDSLTMFDKYAIAFQIRNSIGSDYDFTDEETESKTKIKYKVNFSNVVETVKSLEQDVQPLLTTVVEDGIFQIHCNICSIENEYKIYNQLFDLIVFVNDDFTKFITIKKNEFNKEINDDLDLNKFF